MAERNVLHKRVPPSEAQFSAALVASLGRVSGLIGRGRLADDSGRTTRALDYVFAGSIPTGKGLLDFLLAHDTALDEVLALYGKGVFDRESCAMADAAALAHLAQALATYAAAMADGSRSHTDTLNIAAELRPLLPCLFAIVDEADRIRGL